MVKLWVAKLDVDADESIENQIKPNNTKIAVMDAKTNVGS